MNQNFIEKFDKTEKRKGFILLILYLFAITLGVSVLELTNSSFLVDNATFVWYGILFIVTIVSFFGVVKDSIINVKDKKSFFSKNMSSLLMIGFATMIFMVIVAILIDKFGVINQNEVDVDSALDSQGIWMLIPSILFAPIAEEFVYRYFIFRTIRNYNMLLSHFITAFLFGFSHVWFDVIVQGNLLSIFALLPTFCLGLGCTISYEKTKSIIFPIALHMALNIIASTS